MACYHRMVDCIYMDSLNDRRDTGSSSSVLYMAWSSDHIVVKTSARSPTFGGLLNAGSFCPAETVHTFLSQGFKTVMEIDTVGVFNMSSAAFPALRESGAGAIINISMTLHYGATWFQAHASAAKAAIDSLTRYVVSVKGMT